MSDMLKDHKLTQQDVAKKLNVSQQTVSKWVNGKITPRLDNLIKLSKELNISVEDLIKVFKNKKKIADEICDDTAILEKDKLV